MSRDDIVEKVRQTICHDRQDQYGDPEDSFDYIARFWSIYLGEPVAAEDVAIMMVLLKIARTMTGGYKLDNFIDMSGYSILAGELAGDNNLMKALRDSHECCGGGCHD